MIKLIATDIDGTVAHSKKIHPLTIKAVQKAKELNIPFILATGRNASTIKPIAKKLGLIDSNNYFIGQNGGQVFKFDTQNNPVNVYIDYFSNDHAKEIFLEAKKFKIKIFAYSIDEKFAYVTNKFSAFSTFMKFKSKRQKLLKIEQIENHAPISKFICFGNSKKMPSFINSIKHFNHSIFEFSYASNAHSNIEISPNGVNKAKGLEFVCKTMNINSKDVIFFGDGHNDLEALKWAGIGVVMCNAKDKIKNEINIITDLPCFLGGVGDYLFKYVFDK